MNLGDPNGARGFRSADIFGTIDDMNIAPQQQNPPGSTRAMNPIPDHGEDSWVGRSRLVGMKALITGGDSGIGRAIAIAYAREGAHVAISYLPEEQEDAEDTRQVMGQCVLLPADLTVEKDARQMVDDAARQLGGLDILVNNAGYQWARQRRGIEDVTTEQMTRVFDTNLKGTFWVTQQALRYLSQGSSIITITSIQAYAPSNRLIDYASTKAALANFTANLATEMGPRGIRVNAIAPGPIWTPLQPATTDGDQLPEFGKGTPLGRPGQPAELAGAAVFLASPGEASYVSGTVLGVTGGKPIF